MRYVHWYANYEVQPGGDSNTSYDKEEATQPIKTETRTKMVRCWCDVDLKVEPTGPCLQQRLHFFCIALHHSQLGPKRLCSESSFKYSRGMLYDTEPKNTSFYSRRRPVDSSLTQTPRSIKTLIQTVRNQTSLLTVAGSTWASVEQQHCNTGKLIRPKKNNTTTTTQTLVHRLMHVEGQNTPS